jgi:hypothetical protein
MHHPVLVFSNIPPNLEPSLHLFWIRLQLVAKMLGSHVVQTALAWKQFASVIVAQAHPHFDLNSPSDRFQYFGEQRFGVDVWRLDEHPALGVSHTS